VLRALVAMLVRLQLLRAGGAGAVDEVLVAGVLEAARKLGFGLDRAAFEFVNGSAHVALEVMVMRFAGNFVTGGVAWNLDRGEPLVFDEAADVAVDSRDAERINLFLREREGLIGGERTVGFDEGGADGVFLAGVAGLDDCRHEQTYSSVLRVWSQLCQVHELTQAGSRPGAVRPILRDDDARNGPWQLDNLKQEQDEDDGQDERKPTATVVAETRSHTIATKAEHQNQNNQKDKHL
jgi:hypothetical protein